MVLTAGKMNVLCNKMTRRFLSFVVLSVNSSTVLHSISECMFRFHYLKKMSYISNNQELQTPLNFQIFKFTENLYKCIFYSRLFILDDKQQLKSSKVKITLIVLQLTEYGSDWTGVRVRHQQQILYSISDLFILYKTQSQIYILTNIHLVTAIPAGGVTQTNRICFLFY